MGYEIVENYFITWMVEQEGSILHTKSLEDRLKSIITEINEEVDYWYYLLEPAYNRYLASRKTIRWVIWTRYISDYDKDMLS